jgi:hypothetical protein
VCARRLLFFSWPTLSPGFIDFLDIVWYSLWSFGVWRTEQGAEEVAESRVSRRGSRRRRLQTSTAASTPDRVEQHSSIPLAPSVSLFCFVFSLQEHFSQYLSLERFRNATVQDVMGRPGFGTRNLATSVYKGFSLFYVFEVRRRGELVRCRRISTRE